MVVESVRDEMEEILIVMKCVVHSIGLRVCLKLATARQSLFTDFLSIDTAKGLTTFVCGQKTVG